MSDKNIPVRSVTIDGTVYPLRFGQNALYQLELRLAEMEDERIARGGKARTGFRLDPVSKKTIIEPLRGKHLLKFWPDSVQNQLTFWAALEGGRLEDGKRDEPFTMKEVGKLMDEAGSDSVILQSNLAYNDAHPGEFSKEFLENLLKLEEARKNGPPVPESAPVPESQTAGKHGKRGSSKELKLA